MINTQSVTHIFLDVFVGWFLSFGIRCLVFWMNLGCGPSLNSYKWFLLFLFKDLGMKQGYQIGSIMQLLNFFSLCMWLEKNVFFEGQSFTLDLLCHSAYCFSFVPCSWLFQSCLHNFWCMERVDNLMHSWILILYLHFFNIPLIVLYSLSLV